MTGASVDPQDTAMRLGQTTRPVERAGSGEHAAGRLGADAAAIVQHPLDRRPPHTGAGGDVGEGWPRRHPRQALSRCQIQSWSGWFWNRHARRGPAMTLR